MSNSYDSEQYKTHIKYVPNEYNNESDEEYAKRVYDQETIMQKLIKLTQILEGSKAALDMMPKVNTEPQPVVEEEKEESEWDLL